MQHTVCKIAQSASAILQRAIPAAVCNYAHMVNARDEVVRQVEQMLAQVGMKASPFAKVAGLSSTTLTRFLKNPHAPVLTTHEKCEEAGTDCTPAGAARQRSRHRRKRHQEHSKGDGPGTG
jgi:hypothetical protein